MSIRLVLLCVVLLRVVLLSVALFCASLRCFILLLSVVRCSALLDVACWCSLPCVVVGGCPVLRSCALLLRWFVVGCVVLCLLFCSVLC